jgi:Holliday junction resolvase
LIEYLDSFRKKPSLATSKDDSAWNAFAETLERSKVKPGSLDLAQHGHDLYDKSEITQTLTSDRRFEQAGFIKLLV